MLLYLPDRQSSIRIRQEKSGGAIQSIWKQEVRQSRRCGPPLGARGVWLISCPLAEHALSFTLLRGHVWGRGQIKVTLIHNRKPLFDSAQELMKIKRAPPREGAPLRACAGVWRHLWDVKFKKKTWLLQLLHFGRKSCKMLRKQFVSFVFIHICNETVKKLNQTSWSTQSVCMCGERDQFPSWIILMMFTCVQFQCPSCFYQMSFVSLPDSTFKLMICTLFSPF